MDATAKRFFARRNCRILQLKGLAFLLWWHLRRFYTAAPYESEACWSGSLTELNELLDVDIVYTGCTSVTLRLLMHEPSDVYAWLVQLSAECRSSCYFWFGSHRGGHPDRPPSLKQLKNELWQILLPESVMLPLIALRCRDRVGVPKGLALSPTQRAGDLVFDLDVLIRSEADRGLDDRAKTLREVEELRLGRLRRFYAPADSYLVLGPYIPCTCRSVQRSGSNLEMTLDSLFVPLRMAVDGFSRPPVGRAPLWYVEDALRRGVLWAGPWWYNTGVRALPAPSTSQRPQSAGGAPTWTAFSTSRPSNLSAGASTRVEPRRAARPARPSSQTSHLSSTGSSRAGQQPTDRRKRARHR